MLPERGLGGGAVTGAVQFPSQLAELSEPFDLLVAEFGWKRVEWEVVVVLREQRIDVVGGNKAATRATSAGASAGAHLVDGNNRGETESDIEDNCTSLKDAIH